MTDIYILETLSQSVCQKRESAIFSQTRLAESLNVSKVTVLCHSVKLHFRLLSLLLDWLTAAAIAVIKLDLSK